MSNAKNIIKNLMEENLVDAKSMIKQDLIQKLGVMLEEKIEEVAPSMISEKKDPAPETKEKEENKNLKKKRAVTNFAKTKGKGTEELKDSVEHEIEEEDDTDEDFEAFVDQIHEIVEEIEQETGEELTDDEIAMLGEQYLEFLSEESEN
jgi:hypothetical protein